ncbi:MAG TPA: hypothetical protein VHT26_14940, partial [Trebonia sp.]|nr:hypothetical protein [Trebonia sp.]
FLFDEHFQAGALDLLLEALALAVIVAGVAALSHSHLIAGEDGPSPAGTTGHRPPRTGPPATSPTGRPHTHYPEKT